MGKHRREPRDPAPESRRDRAARTPRSADEDVARERVSTRPPPDAHKRSKSQSRASDGGARSTRTTAEATNHRQSGSHRAGSAPVATVDRGRLRPKKIKRRHGPAFWVLLIVGVLAAAVLIAVFAWFMRQIDPSGPEGADVAIEIPDDISRDELATLLADNEVISSAGAFSIYARIRGYGSLSAGEYTFKENSSMSDVISTLREGPPVIEYKVTIPEGFTISEVAERVGRDVPTISRDDFLAAVASGNVRSKFMPPDATSMEGFLFPDTYVVGEETTAEELLARMAGRFDEIATAVGIAAVPNAAPYEVVTVASMIEEEAKISDERPMISRVIYNRLNAGMPLGIDATLLYTKPADRTLTASELETDSPYNTRTRTGLPPTPITNPGQESLEAAAHPADGSWLYYVLADAEGRHLFSESYQEFLTNKAAAQEKGLL